MTPEYLQLELVTTTVGATLILLSLPSSCDHKLLVAVQACSNRNPCPWSSWGLKYKKNTRKVYLVMEQDSNIKKIPNSTERYKVPKGCSHKWKVQWKKKLYTVIKAMRQVLTKTKEKYPPAERQKSKVKVSTWRLKIRLEETNKGIKRKKGKQEKEKRWNNIRELNDAHQNT